jgi:ubiquinone/menaquinone biosynthesis C-methylase UbiE
MDRAIRDYYATADERGRLDRGVFQLERERTREILDRVLPPAARVLDVGGGAGAYAFWLAARGHDVHLVDASPELVAQAELAQAGAIHRLASIAVGDARALPAPDAAFDAVLMLGPLYHLVERSDRLTALGEARRSLRPDGVLVAAGISRFASLLDGLQEGAVFDDPRFTAIVDTDLVTGRHCNATQELRYFTTAYFHHPEELRAEIEEAGFDVEHLLAVEGPAWVCDDFDRRWREDASRQKLLDYARRVESEPSILGMSPHLLAIGRR